MKVGFLVHQTKDDPAVSKARLVQKFRPLSLLSAGFLHEKLMPGLPVSMLRMGEATGVQSIADGSTTEMVYWAESRSPEQMLRDQRVDRLIQAAICCSKEGAQLIGLGAYTAIIGNGGIEIANAVNRLGVGVTTGNSLTGATGAEGLIELATQVGYEPMDEEVVVVGAGGGVGSVVAKLLSTQVERVLLVGRAGSDLSDLVRTIGKSRAEQVGLSEAFRRSKLIVTVTSETKELDLSRYEIRPGTIFCDIARPRDVAKLYARREDLLIFDGSILTIPGRNYRCDFDYDFEPGTTYACMAETMVLGLEDWEGNYSLGKDLDLDLAQEILIKSKHHGFKLAGYRCFDKPISPDRLEQFSQIVRRRL